jgi:hypothetical protein
MICVAFFCLREKHCEISRGILRTGSKSQSQANCHYFLMNSACVMAQELLQPSPKETADYLHPYRALIQRILVINPIT